MLELVVTSVPGTKQTLKSTAWETSGCRVSGMEAPDEVTCVCVVKWRRKPGVAGYRAINSATIPPALISLNPLPAMKKLR